MSAKKDQILRYKGIVWKYYIKEDYISSRCKLCTKVIKHADNTEYDAAFAKKTYVTFAFQ